MTPYQVAEFIQTAFRFDDDYNVIGIDLNTRFQTILGDDYSSSYRDHAEILNDLNGYYAMIKAKAEDRYGKLPF